MKTYLEYLFETSLVFLLIMIFGCIIYATFEVHPLFICLLIPIIAFVDYITETH